MKKICLNIIALIMLLVIFPFILLLAITKVIIAFLANLSDMILPTSIYNRKDEWKIVSILNKFEQKTLNI